MQRPSTRLIQEYDLCEQFKKSSPYLYSIISNLILLETRYTASLTCKNLESIVDVVRESINLVDFHMNQRSSSAVLKSLYYQDLILIEGIFFYNFGWPDLDITSFDLIIKIMHLMEFAFKDGKKVFFLSIYLI